MRSFFLKYSHVFIFVCLQGLSLAMIQCSKKISDHFWISTVQCAIHRWHQLQHTVGCYFSAQKNYQKLQEENAFLQDLLMQKNVVIQNKAMFLETPAYVLTTAKVVYYTIHRTKNYLIINKGKKQGVEKNMGVITPQGIVGVVHKVWETNAMVTSILHTNFFIAAKILPDHIMGSIQWPGKRSDQMQLLYVPRHLDIALSSSVVTTGHSTIFPPDLPIGKITRVTLPDHASFYDIKVTLHTPFAQLTHVFILKKRVVEDYEQWIKEFRK